MTQTPAVNIGARLIAFDASDMVTRIEDAGQILMNELGYTIELGGKIIKRQKEDLAGLMARVLSELIEQKSFSTLTERLMLTPPIRNHGGVDQIDYIVISGGVSEHVYDRDRTHYGDVGPFLGKEIRGYLKKLPEKKILREPVEGIRATVIGAGEYTMQASGNTSYISAFQLLPAFGLKVVRVSFEQGHSVLETLRQSLAKFDLTTITSEVALFLSIDGQLDYKIIRGVAEGIATLCKGSECAKGPLYLVQDVDTAKSLGAILKEELGLAREVIAIDGIEVGDLDYIDIGKPMGNTEVIPVTVKSLMFYGTRLS